MQFYFPYQQDTVKNNIRLKLLPGLQDNEGLKVERSSVLLLSIPERDTSTVLSVNEQNTQPPTRAQIRYWQWQRELKLVVNNSRYMEPITAVELTSTVKVDAKSLGLPLREKSGFNTDWLTIIIFAALILFASVKYSYSKYLNHLFQSIINYSTSFRMFQEKNVSAFHGALRLELFFYLIGAVFLFQIINHYNIEIPYKNGILFLVCLASISAYFLVKKVIFKIVGSVVEGVQETGEYLFNMDNYNRITGLFLFPVIILIAFNPFERTDIVIVIGILIVGLLYILLIQRGLMFLLKKQFSIYYLFLYLCTLEFLPLLLIYKVVV